MQNTAPTTAPAPGEKGYWRYLYLQMLASMQDGSFLRFSGYSVPNRTFNYRTFDEFQKILEWVKGKADAEDGTPAYKGRTYAGNARPACFGGRRPW